MGGIIGGMQYIFTHLRDRFDSPSCRWGVGEYKDFEDGGEYANGWYVRQPFTNDYDAVIQAIEAMTASGGGDGPEQEFAALHHAGDQWQTTLGGIGDDTIKRLIIWAGDAPGWNGGAKGYPYPTRQAVIDVLTVTKIKVYVLDASGLDSSAGNDNQPGAATAIANATAGRIWHGVDGSDYDALEKAFCKILSGEA